MEIQKLAIEKVIPYIRNPRKNENAVEKVASSIHEFGFRQPIVVDDENVIIAGHTRFEAAKRLGMDTVPVHVAKGLTEQQVKAYRIADNRVSQESEWDMDLLKLELEELDDPELSGFDPDELQNILVEIGEGLTDPDDVPDVPINPVTVTGDLWELGDHRLLCGDATKAEDVGRLMGGEKADMVFTDPPYALLGNSTGVIGITDNKMIIPFFRALFVSIIQNIPKMGHIYVCCDWHSWSTLESVAISLNCPIKNMIVWDKGNAGLGTNYRSRHELILYTKSCSIDLTKTTGGRIKEKIKITDENVWEIKRERDGIHNAQKPVELISRAIQNSSNSSVLDLFIGSGSTLIACQKTGRKCFGMEIDPHYCDVIITRWSEFTGKDDLLLNGKPFKWSERKIKKAA
mgnify:CR=1 FL=1